LRFALPVCVLWFHFGVARQSAAPSTTESQRAVLVSMVSLEAAAGLYLQATAMGEATAYW